MFCFQKCCSHSIFIPLNPPVSRLLRNESFPRFFCCEFVTAKCLCLPPLHPIAVDLPPPSPKQPLGGGALYHNSLVSRKFSCWPSTEGEGYFVLSHVTQALWGMPSVYYCYYRPFKQRFLSHCVRTLFVLRHPRPTHQPLSDRSFSFKQKPHRSRPSGS